MKKMSWADVLFRVRIEANGCWTYLGHNDNPSLYNRHRDFYEHYKGEILEGMEVCHTCDNGCCVNPDHLWLGTIKDNSRDSWQKGRNRFQRMTKAEQKEAICKRVETIGHEGFVNSGLKSAKTIGHEGFVKLGLKAVATMGYERKCEASRKAMLTMGPEVLSAKANKGWETRRRNKELQL